MRPDFHTVVINVDRPFAQLVEQIVKVVLS